MCGFSYLDPSLAFKQVSDAWEAGHKEGAYPSRISLYCQKRELPPGEVAGVLVYEPLRRLKVCGDNSGGEAFAMLVCFECAEPIYKLGGSGMHLESQHSYGEMGQDVEKGESLEALRPAQYKATF